MNVTKSPRGQAMPAGTVSFGAEAFSAIDHTELRWLGGGAAFINSRGTCIMIDPVLQDFDMPLLIEQPIEPQSVPMLDALLVTHIDNDHFSRPTCQALKPVCKGYHATGFVAQVMREEEGLNAFGHAIGETFSVKNVRITLTPAEHNWQNGAPEFQYRYWAPEDYCGFLLDTPDGRIWMPGDSRLLQAQLHLPEAPDVILFDFSDNDWHITFEGAVQLANAYPNAQLICIHWGTVDAPDFSPFNGDPEKLLDRIVNPERLHALLPGEAFPLHKN